MAVSMVAESLRRLVRRREHSLMQEAAEEVKLVDGQQLAMALRGAYLLFHRASQAQLVQILESPNAEPDSQDLSGVEVTADQLLLLSVLSSQQEELTQRQLTDQTFSDASTIRAMLVLLESKGLVARRADQHDGRARRVSLTPAGQKVVARLSQQMTPIFNSLAESVPSEHQAPLAAALAAIAANFDRK